MLSATIATAQQPDAATLVRQRIAQSSDVPLIFGGAVQTISREGDSVIITFRVTEPFRGTLVGDDLVLREWAALWRDDPARFQTGEKGYYFVRAAGDRGFGSVTQRFTELAPGEVLLAPAASSPNGRSRRLRTSSVPLTLASEDFALLLRRLLSENK